jgi:hypothetical protein
MECYEVEEEDVKQSSVTLGQRLATFGVGRRKLRTQSLSNSVVVEARDSRYKLAGNITQNHSLASITHVM